MGRVVIPGFRKIETSGGGEGGTTNYNDLTNKPSINNIPLAGNLNTVNLKLTDATLTEEGVPAEAKAVGTKLNELKGKYAKKDLYDDTTINVGRKADTRIGNNSTAEGYDTTAGGYCSHAEGYDTTADGDCSHAEGQGTNANFDSQHVQGKYNIEDIENKYAHIIGNGNSDRERSNAHTVDWGGNAWYAGDVFNGNGVSLDGLNTNMSDVWNSSVTYGVNSYCIYNNKLWKCKVQHKNQPPTEGTYWTACTISGEISELNSNLAPLNATISINTDYVRLHPFGNNVCRKLGNMIFVTGIVITNKEISYGTTIFTLPSGYHPSEFSILNGLRAFSISEQINSEEVQLNANTNGTIVYYGEVLPAETTLTINGIIFA